MPRISCRRTAASAATRAFTMRTISRGNSVSSSTGTRARSCSTVTPSNAGRLRSSPLRRRSRGTWRGPRHGFSRRQPDPIVNDLHIELGYLYNSPHGTHMDPRTTCGLPGSRAPHLWLTRSGQRISTIDLTGNFLLLAGVDGGMWIRAAAEVADRLVGLPLDAYRVGKDLGDPEGRFCEAFGISTKGAALVRPDGFVAWRNSGEAADCATALREALARSLGS